MAWLQICRSRIRSSNKPRGRNRKRWRGPPKLDQMEIQMHKLRNERQVTLILRGSILSLILLSASIFAAAQTSGPASGSPNIPVSHGVPNEDVKVSFDDKTAGIIYVESNGKRYKVNSVTKSVELAPSAQPGSGDPSVNVPNAEKVVAARDEKEDYYAYESGDEPYDYRLVNVPTARKVPKGTWNMNFTHRFSQPLRPFKDSGPALLGFDSMSSSSFGLMYGITDKLYVNAYRSPLCQRALCRTIELGVGYHITDQNDRSPLAVSAYASIEGSDNFSNNYTYNLQLMVSRRFGKRVFFHFAPAFHINSNGNHRFDPDPNDFTPPATAAAAAFKLPLHTGSFGTGVSVRITPTLSAMFEVTPRVGFKLGQVQPLFDSEFNVIGFKNNSYPAVGVGFQYSVGKHSFTLTLSNTQTTTTSRYNSSNLVLKPKDLIIGFNLFRRW